MAQACFSDAPAPADLLQKGADPYEFQCQQAGKNGVRSLKGEKVSTLQDRVFICVERMAALMISDRT